MKKILLSAAMMAFTFSALIAQTTLTLGEGTSSSATRGPFQRSGPSSTTGIVSSSVFSRANIVYTAAELADLTATATISQINFDLGSSNVITATGDATMIVYMKNSTATEAVPLATTWTDVIDGATVVGTYTFNTTNNFPGAEGFLAFPLDTSFEYTGGTLEIAVDWDSSNLVSIDTVDANKLFSGNGSLNWHWTATDHVSLNYRASSSPVTSLNSGSNRKPQRVNTQIIYTPDVILSNNNFTIDGTTLAAYPVPMETILNIGGIEVETSTLYSLSGAVVATGNNTIDVEALASGVYLLEITSGNESTSTLVVK